jgi:K+-transporting ATPase ATPase C chain
MKKILFTSVIMLLCFTFLCGFIYPAFIWAAAKLAFPGQAKGSLVTKEGVIVGSSLLGQKFTKPLYFHSRPSAVDYNASNSGGSNLAPTNPDLITGVLKNADAEMKDNPQQTEMVPEDLVSASASGLDPQITKEAAVWQIKRVAAARKVDEKMIMAAVDKYTQEPLLGFVGPKMVNVLELNIYIDSIISDSPKSSVAGGKN